MEKYISLDQCIVGRLYIIKSRNLKLGVFDGKDGFIGIREKFYSKYLFTEHHWDTGPPYGTTRPIIDLLTDVPHYIELKESCPTIDKETEREVDFDKPIKEDGRGWFFKDTNEASTSIQPVSYGYKPLFTFLSEREELVDNWFEHYYKKKGL